MSVYQDVMMPGMAHGSSATGQANDSLISAVMPGPVNSFVLGMLGVKQTNGLRSGGMFGYSTFFTGAGPNASLARRASLGRMGLAGVSATSRAVRDLTNVRPGSYAARVFDALGNIQHGGLAGLAGELSMEGQDPIGRTRASVRKIRGRRALTVSSDQGQLFVRHADESGWRVRKGKRLVRLTDESKLPWSVRAYQQRSLGRNAADAMGFDGAARGINKRADAYNRYRTRTAGTAAAQSLKKNKVVRGLAGILGGIDLDADDAIRVSGGRVGFNTAKRGYKVLGGTVGKALGGAFRGAAALTVLEMAGQAATFTATSAYRGLARVTERMQDRFNPSTMSAGYFNRAAATERSRAVQELNTSVLNPRSQLMSNEAYFYHR